MASMPVNKLMLVMGIPMILSMMLQAVYNIVDSAFVSNMAENGELALNALTLAFPVQMLIVAVGIGTGVGANAMLSKSLGEGNREKASRVAGNAIFLGLVIFVVFALFGLFGVRAYISTQTSNPVILEMAVDYLTICSVINIGMIGFSVFEKLLQATGRSHLSTIAQVAGAVTNIVLDPIMIYGLGPCPTLGVKGAAYATVIGQIVSMLLGLIFHLKYNREIDKSLRYLRPVGSVIKWIYTIGLPAIIAQALMSVMTYGMNIILVRVSEEAVTAYGLFYKIQQFILFAAFGMRDAITPIVSYSHGMMDKQRIRSGIRCGLLYTVIIMLACTAVVELFAGPFSNIFGLSGVTQGLCISAMRIIAVSFTFAGINIAFQGIYQALDGGLQSLILSVFRQILLVLPVAFAFSCIARTDTSLTWLVWLTFIISEGVTAIIGWGLLKKFQKLYK